MEFEKWLCGMVTFPLCVLVFLAPGQSMMMHNDNTTMAMEHGNTSMGMDHSPGMEHDPGMDHSPGMEHDPGMDHSPGMEHDPGMDHGTGGVHGAFFFFSNSATLLFEEWLTDSQTFIPTCVGVALLAVFYEGFKILREYLLVKAKQSKLKRDGCCTGLCSCMHLVQAGMHVVQTALSYALMLIFMTFNAWICISLLMGAGIGYLVFAWASTDKRAVNRFDHCH